MLIDCHVIKCSILSIGSVEIGLLLVSSSAWPGVLHSAPGDQLLGFSRCHCLLLWRIIHVKTLLCMEATYILHVTSSIQHVTHSIMLYAMLHHAWWLLASCISQVSFCMPQLASYMLHTLLCNAVCVIITCSIMARVEVCAKFAVNFAQTYTLEPHN